MLENNEIKTDDKVVGSYKAASFQNLTGIWLDLVSPNGKIKCDVSIQITNSGELCLSTFRDINKNPSACDFALVIDKDNVTLQGLVDGKVEQIQFKDIFKKVKGE